MPRSAATSLLGVVLAFAVWEQAWAGETVVVQLQDGRVLTGEVHSQTDDSDLWLRTTGPSILVLSSVAWSEVRSGQIAGQRLSVAEFKQSADRTKTPIPPATFRRAATTSPRNTLPPPPRVRSFELLASLANWDRDVEADGLEVRLSPRAADGSLAAVNGLATVRLLGRRLGTRDRLESQARFGFATDGSNVSEYYEGRGDGRYMELGRWTERIRADQFADQGYVTRLPFRNVHPEHDLDVALDGLVEATFIAQGQPLFRTTVPLQLHTYSPLRDEWQLNRRTRFSADEVRGQ